MSAQPPLANAHQQPSRDRLPALTRDERQLVAWQRRLLPFMMYTLTAVAVVFFVGSLWNYHGLTQNLQHEEPPISQAVADARRLSDSAAFSDWYVRAVLEERALTGRQRQYNAVVQSRLWTRLMGFLAGMVMVLAGSVFVLGKLEAGFDGSAKVPQGEGAVKTNSPGLVLVAAGTILLVVSLVATVDVKSQDELVFLPSWTRDPVPPTGQLKPSGPAEPSPSAEEAATAAIRKARVCAQASQPPADCKKP